MTAFTGTHLMPETIEEFRQKYLAKPLYFEWHKKGTAFTARGVEVVYILGFERGIVKVGQTIDFLTRLTAHRSSPRVRGLDLVCGWRLGTLAPLSDEMVLVELASSLGGVAIDRTGEWFTRVDVHSLIALAETELVKSLPTERPSSGG